MDEIDEALREFLAESLENLDRMDHVLVGLGDAPGDREGIGEIFRTVHTIKGTCGFLALDELGEVAHAGENLLCALRDGQVTWSSEVTDALLALSDTMRRLLAAVTGGDRGNGDHSDLIGWLGHLLEGDNPATPVVAEPQCTNEADACIEPEWTSETVNADETASPDLPPVAEVPTMAEEPECAPASTAGGAEATAKPAPDPVARSTVTVASDASSTEAPRDESTPAGTIRVDVGLLDRLMTLVGELVLARNQILQYASNRLDPGLQGASQRLNMITTELQEGVMKTRMQPIGNVWSKMPRLVRDLARTCGKKVNLDTDGHETELDRTILETIRDPLTHLVRNAVDHGIESPDNRQVRGKPVIGRIQLRAFHESGQVNLEISDDGAGIDVERVTRKAIEAGLLSREQAARMSDRELLEMIFLPGLSTAAHVTSISGRGVGMDVVRTNIERIGGTIEIINRPGQGTTFRIKIPLTLAIVPALILTTRGDRYAIPQINLLELVRLEGENARHGIEWIQGSPVYRLRGTLLPLVHLDQALGLVQATQSGHSQYKVELEAVLRMKNAHLAWNTRLRRFLDGKEHLEVAGLNSSTDCELGRWIQGPGQALSGNVEFANLVSLHQMFHEAVGSCARLHLGGQSEEAKRVLESVETQSHAVVSLLEAIANRADEGSANIVVLQADGRRFGLVVDAISDTEEIVVKPLGKLLKGIPLYAGATIMGDGRVALILDVPGLATCAGLSAEAVNRMAADARAREANESAAATNGRRPFLLLRQGAGMRMAVPLEQVSRLEEIPAASVERSADHEVVQYRDHILPLLRLSDSFGGGSSDGRMSDLLHVIVHARSSERAGVGLVVDEILDVVDDAPRLQSSGRGRGLVGTAVIQDRVTELLDLPGLVRAIDPDLLENTHAHAEV